MKPFFLAAAFLLTAAGSVSAQAEAQQQTQQEWIHAHRNFFIGKPFSVLYDTLSIKPQSIWAGIAHWNIHIEPAHKFFYCDTTNYEDSAYYFYIRWQEPILKTETRKYQNYYYRAFNAQEYPTYADKIIKTLEVYPRRRLHLGE